MSSVQDLPSNSADQQREAKPAPTLPGPITIIDPFEEDHSFKLNEEYLERILLDPKVADKKVCV